MTSPEGDPTSTSSLDPDELDVLELPDRQALSVFSGGIGHVRIDPPSIDPPSPLEEPTPDTGSET